MYLKDHSAALQIEHESLSVGCVFRPEAVQIGEAQITVCRQAPVHTSTSRSRRAELQPQKMPLTLGGFMRPTPSKYPLTSMCGRGENEGFVLMPKLVLNGLKKSSCLSLPHTGIQSCTKCAVLPLIFLFCFFEASSYYVALASLEFAMKKSQPLEC